MIDKNKAKNGDVLIWIKRKREGNWGKKITINLICFWQPIIGQGQGKAYHVAGIVDVENDQMAESTFPKSKLSKIDWNDKDLTLWRVKRSDERYEGIVDLRPDEDMVGPLKRSQVAVRWWLDHLGEWYDAVRLITFGLIDVMKGRVCSQYIAKGYQEAGIELGKGSWRTPNEILQDEDVELIDGM